MVLFEFGKTRDRERGDYFVSCRNDVGLARLAKITMNGCEICQAYSRAAGHSLLKQSGPTNIVKLNHICMIDARAG